MVSYERERAIFVRATMALSSSNLHTKNGVKMGLHLCPSMGFHLCPSTLLQSIPPGGLEDDTANNSNIPSPSILRAGTNTKIS